MTRTAPIPGVLSLCPALAGFFVVRNLPPARGAGDAHLAMSTIFTQFTQLATSLVGASGAWIALLAAGLFEVGWAVGLKYTHGFTRPVPSLLTAAAMIASLYLLAVALRHLPLGTAYAVWTGVGTVGTALLGIVLFGEPATVARLGCILCIVAGIAGLKLLAGE